MDPDEHTIELNDYESVSTNDDDDDDDSNDEDQQINTVQPAWIKIVMHIIKICKLITYLTFFILFIKFSWKVYSFDESNFMSNLLKVLWGFNTMIILFNMIIIMNEYMIDCDFFGRSSGFVVFNNAVKFLSYFTFFGSVAMFLLIIISPIPEEIYPAYLTILIYYCVEVGSIAVFLILFVVMCRIGIGINYMGLMISFMNNVPVRTGAQDEELNQLKEYRLINKNDVITLYDFIEDKEISNCNEGECIICHTDYENNDTIRHFECNHYYHKDCCDEWLKISKTCPMCRKEIIFA